MVAILTVPEQKASDSSAVDLRPGHTRSLLAKLPLLDSQDSVNQLLATLHPFNRAVVVPGIRLRLLELYRTPIGFIGENVGITLSESYIPLSQKHATLAETCRQVTIEMAYGYKSIVIDLAKGGRSKRPQEDLCTAIHRAIKYMTLTLHQSAMQYISYPAGTWAEIHSLYTYAVKLGIQERKVNDALNPCKVKNTVAHAYQQALLYGLSDCYRNSIPINSKILRYVERWASSAEVTKFKTPDSNRFCFVINPEDDLAAAPYTKELVSKKSKRFFLINTKQVTKVAHYHWRKMRGPDKPKSSSLGEDFFDIVAHEMLQRLVVRWGVTPKRRYPRNQTSGLFDLALGVNASNYFLNGATSFKPAPTSKNSQLEVSTTGTFGMYQLKRHGDGFETQEWSAKDESINGFCLRADISGNTSVRIRVGEVVALRARAEKSKWSTGLVRWVRIFNSELRIGLQKVGVGAMPIAVRPAVNAKSVNEYFKHSILLPEHQAIQQKQSIITPPGAYKRHRNLIVDDGQKLMTIKANRLIEHDRQYEWFDYEVV